MPREPWDSIPREDRRWVVDDGSRPRRSTDAAQRGGRRQRGPGRTANVSSSCSTPMARRPRAFDASVVRGLAYYTGIVFEAFDTRGTLRAVCGGGRYDHLTRDPRRANRMAGRGFRLRRRGDRRAALGPRAPRAPWYARALDDVVYAQQEAQRTAAIALATSLRNAGRAASISSWGAPSPKRVPSRTRTAPGPSASGSSARKKSPAARGWVRDLETGERRREPPD